MRQKDVEVLVAVEIDQRDARRAPIGMRRGIDGLGLEGKSRSRVEVSHDCLELLREEADDVEPPVAVEIDWNRSNAAGPRIDDVLDELRRARAGRLVL